MSMIYLALVALLACRDERSSGDFPSGLAATPRQPYERDASAPATSPETGSGHGGIVLTPAGGLPTPEDCANQDPATPIQGCPSKERATSPSSL